MGENLHLVIAGAGLQELCHVLARLALHLLEVFQEGFGQGADAHALLDDDFDGRPGAVPVHHIAGQGEHPQARLGVVVEQDVAAHDEVHVGLVDHRAVGGGLDVGKHGLLHAGQGLVHLGLELLVLFLDLLLHDHVVDPQPEAGLVGREHGHEELGGEVRHPVGPHALVERGELFAVGHIVTGDEVGEGEGGAVTRPVEVGLAVDGEGLVTGPGGLAGISGGWRGHWCRLLCRRRRRPRSG